MRLVVVVLLAFVLNIAVCNAKADADVDEDDLWGPDGLPKEKPEVITRPPPEDPTLGVGTFDEAQVQEMDTKKQAYEFQAEVNRLMDIIINSLYKERDIFLRELISNSADALDKVRYIKLQKGILLTDEDLWIRIKPDKTAKTLTISDSGIGMTREELIKNLGVVARSGTTEFVKAASREGADALTLIGQFGVGFYSVYLVSDRVTVVSKHDDDDQHIWQSTAERTFTVTKDPRGNTIERGTSVIMQLKGDAEEFLEQNKLEALIGRYSQFIAYPIYLYTWNTLNTEVHKGGVEEDPEEDEELGSLKGDDLEVSEEEDEDKPKKKKKSSIPRIPIFKTEQWEEWKLINSAKAIWMRNPKDIREDEYEGFYKSITKDNNGFLTKIHFNAEGEITFRSILYVPKQAEWGLYDKFYERSTALKLYVRKVLISDQFDDFLPKYLNFIKGVVDSDDLPLNVSRETLQQNKVLKVMAKKITRKVLEMLTRMAEGEKKKEKDSDEEEEAGDEDVEITTSKEDYETFYKEFGKSIKLGVMDDRGNRAKLSKLLRYATSKTDGKLISLDKYVENMKEDQRYIYYITGESIEVVQHSPMLERLKRLDIEVLYMVDPLDEYVVNTMTDYDGNQLMSVTKKDLKLPGVEDDLERLQEEYKDVCEHLEKIYGKKVEKVDVGTRMTDTPAVLVTGQYGWTANMERIIRAQTFGDAEKHQYMAAKKIMEINPHHPIIKEFKKKIDSGADLTGDQPFNDMVNLIYDAALINSGFAATETTEFAHRIHRVVAAGLGVSALPTEDSDHIHEDL